MATLENTDDFRLPKWLYIYWKILGVCPIVLVGKKIVVFKKRGILYAVVLTLTYIFLYARVCTYRIFLGQPHETSSSVTADFLGLSMEFLTIVTSWLFFGFRQNELREIIKMVRSIKALLKISVIDPKAADSIRVLKVTTILMNVTWLLLYGCDMLFIYDYKTFQYDVWLPFNVPRLVSHNVVIIYLNSLLTMKKIFHFLNNGIRDLWCDAGFELSVPRRVREASTASRGKLGVLEVFGQIHSDLVSLTKAIVHFFSLCILLAILGHLYLMASDLYMLCMMIKDKDIWNAEECIPFFVIGGWLAFHVCETVLVVAISDAIAKEVRKPDRKQLPGNQLLNEFSFFRLIKLAKSCTKCL